jgi:hypothetical protein
MSQEAIRSIVENPTESWRYNQEVKPKKVFYGVQLEHYETKKTFIVCRIGSETMVQNIEIT